MGGILTHASPTAEKGTARMTATIDTTACGSPDTHEWALTSVDFEEYASVRIFECLLCGSIDYR
ncbi:hypothetical protein GCM10009798_35370 [Nocardioides panacihumi]|uniref:Uncharacterized protein n=1 Tax=Nocardioides panacihumi TaxID=400774 RepID=A0ABP5CZ47_9ACTN